jgi:chitosanase
LPQLQACDVELDRDVVLHNVLRASADDPVMREIQDEFFDEVYFEPAARAADRFGITQPLGVAVVYDGKVHGSWDKIRARVEGTPADRGEQVWIRDYVAARRAWLAGSSRSDLRATVYRMDAFNRLIEQGMWSLELPLIVRGAEISAATLSATPPRSYDGPAPGTRALMVQAGLPVPRGLDVRLVQLGLSDRPVRPPFGGRRRRAPAPARAAADRRRGHPAGPRARGRGHAAARSAVRLPRPPFAVGPVMLPTLPAKSSRSRRGLSLTKSGARGASLLKLSLCPTRPRSSRGEGNHGPDGTTELLHASRRA